MNKSQKVSMLNYLLKQQQRGMNWAAYPGFILPKSWPLCVPFSSAIDADQYCLGDAGKGQGRRGQSQLRSYFAINNYVNELRRSLTRELKVNSDIATVEEQVLQMGAVFLDDSQSLAHCAQLATGDVVMAGMHHTVIPFQDVGNFLLIQQTSKAAEGGNRTIKRLGQSSDLKEIITMWESRLDEMQLQSGEEAHTLRVVGAYNGMALELGVKGEPNANTGVQLIAATWAKGKLTGVGSIDPTVRINVMQYVFLQHDEVSGKLIALDDTLRPVTPGALQRSYGSLNFVNSRSSLLAVKARQRLLHEIGLVHKASGNGGIPCHKR